MQKIKKYLDFIFETELKHISEGGISKLSILTILTLYAKLFDLENIKRYLPVSTKILSDEYIQDAQPLKKYLKEIFEPILFVEKTNNKKTLKFENLTDKLHEKPFHYIYYDAKKPVMLLISTVDFTPIKKDFLYDPKEFYVIPDIQKAGYEKVEDFLYLSGVKDQTIIDNYWDRKLEDDPFLIKKAEKEISNGLKNKWKHLSKDSQFYTD